MTYTETQLKSLAHSNPKELARILTSPNANTRMLTFGAEILGDEVKDGEIVIPVLRQLLKHVNAIVREGAVIGITAFFADKKLPQDILDRLKVMSSNDPSPTLKEMAKDLIKESQ